MTIFGLNFDPTSVFHDRIEQIVIVTSNGKHGLEKEFSDLTLFTDLLLTSADENGLKISAENISLIYVLGKYDSRDFVF